MDTSYQQPKRSRVLPALAIIAWILVLGAAATLWWFRNQPDSVPPAATAEVGSTSTQQRTGAALTEQPRTNALTPRSSEVSRAAVTTTVSETTTITSVAASAGSDLSRTSVPDDAEACASDGVILLLTKGPHQGCREINRFLPPISHTIFPYLYRDPMVNVSTDGGLSLALECYRINPTEWRCVGNNGEDFYARAVGRP